MTRFIMKNSSVYKLSYAILILNHDCSINKLFFQAYLTFHTYGQYILYPWGYNRHISSNHEELNRVGQVMAKAIKNATSEDYTVGNSAALLYPAAGTCI